MRTAVIGGGAAGFFLAINLKEMCPSMDVTIIEASQRVLRKVEVSGGGRCNCTNSFDDVSDLQSVYPRGHRLMKRLFWAPFSHRDAYRWFEQHGVALVTQDDHCVFPRSQDSHTIIEMFLREAHRLHIRIVTGHRISSMDELGDYDFVAVTTGGQPRMTGLLWLEEEVVEPVPSLFSFGIDDTALHDLKGIVAPKATAMIPGTKLRAAGPLLITHWGMSGPCILRLSSYAARHLHDTDYRAPLMVNWVGMSEEEALTMLQETSQRWGRQKQVLSVAPCALTQRHWAYLAGKALGTGCQDPWSSQSNKSLGRLSRVLTADEYRISGRAPHHDEFVTCGGVALRAVNPATLESRQHPRRYYAGEVLDIDGVTGGFNFQAAWTTAFTVAKAIASLGVKGR